MKPELHEWLGAYDSSWTGIITPESFAHPAKFARGLIERIFDYCLEKGYLKRGDRCGDPFAGIGTGGICAAYRGLHWYGVELEPRFIQFAEANFKLHRHGWAQTGKGTATIIQGDSRKFAEKVAGVVTSPPYAGNEKSDRLMSDDGKTRRRDLKRDFKQGHGCFRGSETYGTEDGQIGSLKSGQVESVITSPPFTQGYQGGGGINKNGYQGKHLYGKNRCGNPDQVGKRTYQGQGGDRTQGNIETLKEGTVAAVVSSSPYSESNQTTGQISRLKGWSVDGVVSSPPWEDNCEGQTRASKFNGYVPTNGKGHYASPEARARSAARADQQADYGQSEGQIGKESGETYWQAVDAVYRSCFHAIKPGGIIVLVVKDYCAKGKRVRLRDDTLRLLEHIGFQPLERIHAMLVTETVENGLFGEHRTKKQRKSFFRRLYEAKLPEEDDRRIDFEEVLICRRP